MGSIGTKNRRHGMSIEKKYAKWRRIAGLAEGRALRSLHAGATADEIAAAVRKYASEIDRIPAPVRAMEVAMHDAERLVAMLTAAGVRFPAGSDAPAQLAACSYAAWSACHNGDCGAVDWMSVAGCLIDGIEHALTHKTGVPSDVRALISEKSPRARKAVRR